MINYTILADNFESCMMCGSHQWIERHHVMPASNRKKSEKYGLIAPLCHYCHNEPPHGIHHNRENDRKLRAMAQLKFEEVYPNEDWLRIFGKNFKHHLEES